MTGIAKKNVLVLNILGLVYLEVGQDVADSKPNVQIVIVHDTIRIPMQQLSRH
jgi:hypothetical protein